MLSVKEECEAKEELHFLDDVDDNESSKVYELQESPNASRIVLCVQGNYEITSLPPSFFNHMPFLQVLNLSQTSIKSLPESLPKLVSLKRLVLQGCPLFMELSPQVGTLTKLEFLDLDRTEIVDLPREIGMLAKLSYLTLSFYQTYGGNKLNSNRLIHPDTVFKFSQLSGLSIDVNPTDERWDDSVEAVVREVCNSNTLNTLHLYLPKFQLLDYISPICHSLSNFRFTVGHHKRRIISRIPHEVEEGFRNWDKCLKFVNGENIPTQIQEVLKYSTSFCLDRHATATSLSEFGIENMKRLKFCLLTECNNMETIVHGQRFYQGKSKPIENGFESLVYLNIYYMDNLESICRGPNGFGCISNLKFLGLHTCPRLINIFSRVLLENFVNLEEFILEDCPQVTCLVSYASVKPKLSDKFLPSLKRLLLVYLPELVSISNGLLIAPKLKSIGFYNCPKLKSISKMEMSSKSLNIIKGECEWWEDMKWDESEWGNRPDQLMHIFSPINNEQDVMTQFAEDRDILDIEDVNWDEPNWIPISPIQIEGQQEDDLSLGQWLDSVLEPIPSECILFPSTPLFEGPEQAWSFSSENNKWLEYAEPDPTSEIVEEENYEDEPKAKRWQSEKTVRSTFEDRRYKLFGLTIDTKEEAERNSRKDDNETKGVIFSFSGTESNITTESDTTDSSNSCFNGRANQPTKERSLNEDKLVKMIPSSDLEKVLVGCGKAVNDGDTSTAVNIMHSLEHMVSVSGKPIQRLGAYVVEALRARLESSGSTIYKALKHKEATSSELMSCMNMFYNISPYWRFAYISANIVLKEVMENEPIIHIIDFQIVQGTQWMFLILALAKRSGRPPSIRITAFDDVCSSRARGGGLDIVAKRLSTIAESCNVQLEFHDASMSDFEFHLKHLIKVKPGEALAVNIPYASIRSQRDQLLKLVKSLSPKVVTLAEQELNTNTSPFLARFLETLDYYRAVFESIDRSHPRDDEQRIHTEHQCVGHYIMNIIACEGTERIERHEALREWRSRFSMAGFSPYPFSSTVSLAIQDMLKEYHNDFTLEQRDGALFLGWMSRALATFSSWR